MYTRAVADLAVQNRIEEETIAQRNLTLSGNVSGQTVSRLDDALGDLAIDRQCGRQCGLYQYP